MISIYVVKVTITKEYYGLRRWPNVDREINHYYTTFYYFLLSMIDDSSSSHYFKTPLTMTNVMAKNELRLTNVLTYPLIGITISHLQILELF